MTAVLKSIRDWDEKTGIVLDHINTSHNQCEKISLRDVDASKNLQCQLLTANTPQKIYDVLSQFKFDDMFEMQERISMHFLEPKCDINGDNTVFCTVNESLKISDITSFVIRVYTSKMPKCEAWEAKLTLILQDGVTCVNVPYAIQTDEYGQHLLFEMTCMQELLAFHGLVTHNTDHAISATIKFKMRFLTHCIPSGFIPLYSELNTIKMKDDAKEALLPIFNKFKFTWQPNIGILYFKVKTIDDADWRSKGQPLKYEPFGDISQLISYRKQANNRNIIIDDDDDDNNDIAIGVIGDDD